MGRKSYTSTRLIVAFTLATIGIAMCAKGIHGSIVGQSIQKWLVDGSEVYAEAFTGAFGIGFCIAEISVGLSLILLSFLVPRAYDARVRRGGYFELPWWQRGLLIASLIMLTCSILFIFLGPFF